MHDRNLKHISTLKKLSTDRNIVITKPDKGSGIVILNKKDYIDKMNVILEDSTKFSKHGSDLYKTLLKLEDKTNRIIEEMFKQKIINQSQKSDLKTSGSRPGIIYGLPKIHKRLKIFEIIIFNKKVFFRKSVSFIPL